MSATEPFDYLAELALSYKQANPELPAQETVQNTWSGIGFSLAGQRMLAPLGDVIEMMPVPETTKLPGVQDWVMGLANVRGRLLPLFDLEAFFGGKLGGNKLRQRVLVIEMGDLYAGLVVNEVYGMQVMPEDSGLEQLPETLGHLSPYSTGAFDREGLIWVAFSPQNLVRDPRFFDASAA
jgi:twitching motility protein PilI